MPDSLSICSSLCSVALNTKYNYLSCPPCAAGQASSRVQYIILNKWLIFFALSIGFLDEIEWKLILRSFFFEWSADVMYLYLLLVIKNRYPTDKVNKLFLFNKQINWIQFVHYWYKVGFSRLFKNILLK